MSIGLSGVLVELEMSDLIPGREYWILRSADPGVPLGEWETVHTVTPDAPPGEPDGLATASYAEPMDGTRAFCRLATEALPQ